MEKVKLFKFVFFALLLLYLSLYFTSVSGYYEYKNYKKMSLTEEQIVKFEEDIKAGKNVNVEDYIIEEKRDYNNKIANAGKKLSFTISGTLSKILNEGFKGISKFVTE